MHNHHSNDDSLIADIMIMVMGMTKQVRSMNDDMQHLIQLITNAKSDDSVRIPDAFRTLGFNEDYFRNALRSGYIFIDEEGMFRYEKNSSLAIFAYFVGITWCGDKKKKDTATGEYYYIKGNKGDFPTKLLSQYFRGFCAETARKSRRDKLPRGYQLIDKIVNGQS